ncbi:MAG TPA: nicotinate-nucleotide adenylyltransferase [Chloroflexota bacterium]
MTRLGLLGGTFDPPHYGHLVAAQEAHWQLGLERVLFLPARQNPLKRGEASSDAHMRCEMVRLAIDGDDRFEMSELDLNRPGPSYTVDLLRLLARPDRELYFLAGADILTELPRWHAPLEMLRLATLVIANRPGAPPPDIDLLDLRLPGAAARIRVLDVPGVDIASRDLRARVRAGQPIRYLLPPAVERYIVENGLYGS